LPGIALKLRHGIESYERSSSLRAAVKTRAILSELVLENMRVQWFSRVRPNVRMARNHVPNRHFIAWATSYLLRSLSSSASFSGPGLLQRDIPLETVWPKNIRLPRQFMREP
jgi:hypothetical protein